MVQLRPARAPRRDPHVRLAECHAPTEKELVVAFDLADRVVILRYGALRHVLGKVELDFVDRVPPRGARGDHGTCWGWRRIVCAQLRRALGDFLREVYVLLRLVIVAVVVVVAFAVAMVVVVPVAFPTVFPAQRRHACVLQSANIPFLRVTMVRSLRSGVVFFRSFVAFCNIRGCVH